MFRWLMSTLWSFTLFQVIKQLKGRILSALMCVFTLCRSIPVDCLQNSLAFQRIEHSMISQDHYCVLDNYSLTGGCENCSRISMLIAFLICLFKFITFSTVFPQLPYFLQKGSVLGASDNTTTAPEPGCFCIIFLITKFEQVSQPWTFRC